MGLGYRRSRTSCLESQLVLKQSILISLVPIIAPYWLILPLGTHQFIIDISRVVIPAHMVELFEPLSTFINQIIRNH